jgi:hypothetical protein
MNRTFIALLLFAPFAIANAQVKSDGKWYFPDSVRALCVDAEQGMVATYRGLIETNRKMADPKETNDKSQLMAISNAHKVALVEAEEKWSRLGCAAILYGTDRKGR